MTKKLDILVDGFNLGLTQGSGIKTYGMTLLDAYASIGHKVGILTDNSSVDGKNSLLDEINFFDQQHVRQSSFFDHQYIRNLRDLSHTFLRPTGNEIIPKVTLPNPQNYLSKVSGDKYQYLANISDVFHSANRLFGALGKNTTIKMPHTPDIWHMTTPLPIKVPGVKTVITIHDLIPLKVPFTTLDIKNNFYYLFKWAVKYADLILSVSEHTKKDIMEFFDVPEEKIKVTYQSYKQTHREVDDEFVEIYLQSKELESERYILFVGNIEPKKNIKSLITAMAFLDEGYKLAIVGKKAWMADQQLNGIDKYLYKEQYVFLDYVNEIELSILYKNALCLVFPSLYEGFGLPVLEAMQNDCPVLCSGITSLPEVAGDAALYVDPYDYTDVRDKLKAIIANPEMRQDMIKKGRKQVDFFSPANYVDRLNDAYESIL
ncbi:MAG: glycosyltransferase family 4 protein [Proteobacteria bacterium]|nr:glycosyltransferase family 4 protein [Pseudomonadota bacterium]